MKGCLTTIIFLMNIGTFGSGIIGAFFVGTAYSMDYVHAESWYDLPTYYWILWLVGIVLFLKLLYKGSMYLSEFVVSLFSSDESKQTSENNQ